MYLKSKNLNRKKWKHGDEMSKTNNSNSQFVYSIFSFFFFQKENIKQCTPKVSLYRMAFEVPKNHGISHHKYLSTSFGVTEHVYMNMWVCEWVIVCVWVCTMTRNRDYWVPFLIFSFHIFTYLTLSASFQLGHYLVVVLFPSFVYLKLKIRNNNETNWNW